MPALLPSRVPSYRRHKPTGQAIRSTARTFILESGTTRPAKPSTTVLWGSGLWVVAPCPVPKTSILLSPN